MRMLALSLLAACGGGAAKPTTPTNTATTPSILPPAYAALFREASTTFKGELVRSEYGENGPESTKESAEVTCRIINVKVEATYSMADLICEPAGDGAPGTPTGTLVGTANGLYVVDAFDGDLTKLSDKQLILHAQPKKDKREWKDDENPDFGSGIIIEPHAGGWCSTMAMWSGDDGGWTICVREGNGVIGGHSWFGGGMTKDLYFGDVPRT